MQIQDKWSDMLATLAGMHRIDNGTYNFMLPCALQVSTDKDTLHYEEMLQANDQQKFT
jgi:hypothetical protein